MAKQTQRNDRRRRRGGGGGGQEQAQRRPLLMTKFRSLSSSSPKILTNKSHLFTHGFGIAFFSLFNTSFRLHKKKKHQGLHLKCCRFGSSVIAFASLVIELMDSAITPEFRPSLQNELGQKCVQAEFIS